MTFDWQSIWHYFVEGCAHAFNNVALFCVALGGATCAYLLYSFPESKILKQRLRELFPKQKAPTLARLNFTISILLGTFVALVLLQPATAKEAFLAGFAWLGALRHLIASARKQSGNGGSKS